MNDMPDHAPYEGDVIEPPRTTSPAVAANPFQASMPDHVNAGAVAIESQKAAAEVQGRMVVAKRFPRDSAAAYVRSIEACRRMGLAKAAVYTFPRGGQKVSGPSIRLAEELARHWGNIEYGLNELSRRPGESEMEAFAWDLETNTRSSQRFTVRHLRDKKGGAEALKDERDVYEITANMGSRRVRARILAILPPELVDDAVAKCAETVKRGGGEPLTDRIRKLVVNFAALDVTPEMIIARLEHPIDQITPDEIVELTAIGQSIHDGVSGVKEWFGPKAAALPAAPKDADPFEAASAGKADAAPADPDAERNAAFVAACLDAIGKSVSPDGLSAWVKKNQANIAKLPSDKQGEVDDAIAAKHEALATGRRAAPEAGGPV